MEDEIDLRAIARRAVGRVVAAGRAGPTETVTSVDPAGPRPGPAPRDEPALAAAGPALVSAGCLAEVPDGGEFVVPRGARVTPLAREEAFRRGVRFLSEGRRPGAQRVAVAGDHAGRALKADVLTSLRERGVPALDLGSHDDAACDYPDLAAAVARAVAEGRADLGVVVDGAGSGSSMAANKLPGVLAANCWDERSARNAREHNHANVLCLGAGHLDRARAHAILAAFLSTPPGPGRHARRVAKIHALAPAAPRAETRP